MAQAYREGELLETVEAVTSQDILLKGTGYMGGGKYLCLQGYSDDINSYCRYRLEKVSGQVDGLNLYVLKNVSSGLYVKDYTLPTTDGEDSEEDSSYLFNGKGIDVHLLKDKAMQFTVSLAVENGDDPRSTTTQGQGQDLSQPSFVLARKYPSANGTIQYFGHYYNSPYYSIHNDTNAWQIHAIDEPLGKEKLQAYMDAHFANNTNPSLIYPAGTNPGSYPAELVAAAHAAYAEANDALNADPFTLTDGQVDDLCNRIDAAIEKLKNSAIPMADGIYFIHDSRGLLENYGNTMFLYGDKEKDYIYSDKAKNYISANGNYTKPAKLNADAVKYLWRVKLVKGDSATIQNVLTGLYFTHEFAVANHFGLSQSETLVLLRKGSETGDKFNHSSFYIKDTKNTKRACANPRGWVLNWNYDNDPGNQFVFESVSEDELSAVLEEAKQDVRNEQLAALYGDAVYALNKGISYAPAASYVLDNDFSAEGALVRHTGDEDNTPWYCNNKQGGEGTYEALTSEGWDGLTYFHSSWSGGAFEPSISKNHYLVAELEQDATGDILVKVAKRACGDDYPTQFAVYGANKFDKEHPNATEWKFQGLADINYTDSVAVTYTDVDEKGKNKVEGGTKTVPDAVGVAAMHLDGSYAYIKLAATKTLFNEVNKPYDGADARKRGFFALAKLNIWEAAEPVVKIYTPEFQELQNTNGTVIADLQAQIEAAGKQVADSSATDAQIASLQAALDAFNNNYPDPNRVTTALANASSIYDVASSKGLIGDKLAQYPTAVAEELAAVVAKYQGFNSIKLVDINAAVDEISAAVTKFKASIKLPESGKFYTLRSASKKYEMGSNGVSYRGVIYSASNDATNEVTSYNTPIRYYRLNGSSTIRDSVSFAKADFTKLQDTVSIADDARLVWKAEASANGQMTLRNLATGMYLTGANGKIYQSIEATPINVEGVAPETFRFNAGKDEYGVTQYMNIRAYSNTIVTWSDTTDVNSNFFIEEVAKEKIATRSFYIPNVKEGQFYAGTFPVDIAAGDGYITAYKVIGINGDKLVLGAYDDVVEAGTPFIYSVDMVLATASGENSTFGFTHVVAANDLTEGHYTYETKNVNGLQGVLTEAVAIPAGKVYINNSGAVAVVPETGVDIAANGAYFDGEIFTITERGDEELPLSKAVLRAMGAKNDNPADWQVDASAYEHTMNVIGRLMIGDKPVAREDETVVAAFNHEGNCIGVASPVYNADYDDYRVMMTIYGNNADLDNAVTFKVWCKVGDRVFDNVAVSQNITMVANAVYGTLRQPIVMNAGGHFVNQNIGLHKGWQWISMNVQPVDCTIASFDDILHSAAVVKGQSAFAVPSADESSWQGDLSELNYTASYQIKMNVADSLHLYGAPIDLATEACTIVPGWNWIGYTPRYSATFDYAMANLNPAEGDVLKAQDDFAVYDNGKWFGTLGVMTPGKGYMYMRANQTSGTLRYPAEGASSAALAQRKRVTAAIEDRTSAFPEVDRHAYPNNMTMIISLVDKQKPVEGAEIAAFVGDECRGTSKEVDGLYFLTVTGEGSDQPLMLRVARDGNVVNADSSLAYNDNAMIGTATQPYVVDLANVVTAMPEVQSTDMVNIMPHRVSTQVTVSASGKALQCVTLYNAQGQLCYINQTPAATERIDMTSMPAGVYIVKAVTADGRSHAAQILK